VNQTWGKYLLNLEDLVKESNYESTALPAMMIAAREEGGGQIMSIPYQPNINVFFYNKKHFKDAGITEVPKTFDEFLSDCQMLVDKGYTPLTMDDAYATYLIGMHLEREVGEEKLKEIVKEGEWDDPAVKEFADTYAQMSAKGFFSKNAGANVWPSGQNSEFATGEVSMYYTGSWLPNEVNSIAGQDFEWGAFAYPDVEGGKTDTKANVYGSQCFAVNKNSKVSKECFDLICRITQGEGDKTLADESNGIPADINNKEWPALVMPVYDIMNNSNIRLSWGNGIEANDDMIPAIKENFQKLVGGELDAQGFVDAMSAVSK
jgi:hypothetical protein